MNTRFLSALVATSLLLFGGRPFAAEESKAKAELEELVGKVQVKLKDGKTTEQDLEDELKGFDRLLAKYKEEKTDDVAQILMMKAMLYVQVMEDSEKGLPLLKQLKSDFPETSLGKKAEDMIASVEKQQEADKVKRTLVVGSKFPDFEEKDTAGKPLAIANYKGKVVLLDFWATWCGPCVAELPNVLKTYEKYHEQGFEIIGISLDKDEEALNKFIKQKKMSWVQFFDGKGWQNKLATKYGINSIPATYLLDGEGKIIAKDLRGDALAAAVGKALAKP